MSEPKSARVAAIELVGSALWPTVAITIAIFFAPSIKILLDSAASQVKNATTVKVGSIELTVSKDNIPSPPDSVAAILPHLGADDIEFIISRNSGEGPDTYCYENAGNREIDEIKHLKTLGIFTEVTEIQDPKTRCNDVQAVVAYDVNAAHLCSQVRGYFFDIIKTLKFKSNA